MSLKSFFGKIYAAQVVKNIYKWAGMPTQVQEAVLIDNLNKAKNTAFGKDHWFSSIKSYEDFKKNVPIKDYEGLKPYLDRVSKGESDITWPGKPIYLCKTSGTTSGAKYIPISKESISNHIDSAKNALLCYIHKSGNTDFIDGKMIFLQGSPVLEEKNGISFGRLSGIVAHHVPAYLQRNRMPSMKTNCMDDWETKVDAIVDETINQDMRLISGIPSWVQMYFERLIEKSEEDSIKNIFKNFSLFVYGGVNFGPYEPIFKKLIGEKIDSVETYPASEGFIAFQDNYQKEGLLLVLNKGIFYEFIPVETIQDENPIRLKIDQVELGKNYAIVLNTNAGLWGYLIGDTVKFVSKNPYRIVVTGRIKHFTSAFGEHVIAEEVESSIKQANGLFASEIKEFHVAPQVKPKNGLPYHEWFIEFNQKPANMDAFKRKLDELMQAQNPYYKDLITGNILQQLVVTEIKKNGFIEFMKSRGKLGGQNKIPRLANDRQYADELEKFAI